MATDLVLGARSDPRFMPLGDFISESMALLRADPAAAEICVARVGMLRSAASEGRYDETFDVLNPAR